MKAARVIAGGAGTFLLVCAVTGFLRAGEAEDSLKNKALALNNITGDDPVRGQLLALIEDAAGTKKLLAVAYKMVKDKSQPFNLNATYLLARAAQRFKEVDISEKFYRLYAEQALKLQSGQKLGQAYGGLIQVLTENKKYPQAEKVCREFLELEAEDRAVERLKPAVLRRLILILAREGAVDKAFEMIDQKIKEEPENWLNLELKASLHRDVGQYAEAAKTYESVIDRVKNDDRLGKDDQNTVIDEIRYSLSGVYVDLNKIDKAAEQLKALLSREPDNPTYNNDLGYIWADHDLHLEESEKMIRKAIDEDRKLRHKENPDLKPSEDRENAAYLDSLGWVLYKQKKYKEAKVYLLRAVADEDGRHLEIYDHLGDVHMALGEKAEALDAWRKGIEAAGDTKREQLKKVELEKKLQARQEK